MPNWTPERRLLSALSDVAGAISHMSQMARETPHARQDALRALKLLEQAEQIMGRDITRQLSLPSIMASTKKTALEQAWGPVLKQAASASLLAINNDVEFLIDATTGLMQVGMGGEWWSGPFQLGRSVLRHRKERVDEAYRPVEVRAAKGVGSSTYLITVSGGFGYEAGFKLKLS